MLCPLGFPVSPGIPRCVLSKPLQNSLHWAESPPRGAFSIGDCASAHQNETIFEEFIQAELPQISNCNSVFSVVHWLT